jgi:hypothetical protein
MKYFQEGYFFCFLEIKIASCKTLSFLLLKNFAVLQPSFQKYKTTSYLATARNKSIPESIWLEGQAHQAKTI